MDDVVLDDMNPYMVLLVEVYVVSVTVLEIFSLDVVIWNDEEI